jgi:hypothetical protein
MKTGTSFVALGLLALVGSSGCAVYVPRAHVRPPLVVHPRPVIVARPPTVYVAPPVVRPPTVVIRPPRRW